MVQRYPGGQPVGYEPTLDGTEIVSVWGLNPNDSNKPRTLSQQTTTGDIAALAALDASFISVVSFGADPTGLIDSTAAINAAIVYGIQTGINVFAPAGTYTTSDDIVVGAPYAAPAIFSGWKFFGAGAGGNGLGGTTFRYIGVGGTAVVKVNGGTAWRNISLEDFTCLFAAGSSAPYGVLLNSTEFSQANLRRIKVDAETDVSARAYGVLAGTGVNGEFTTFEQCKAFNVDSFYYVNAGQAFCPTFINCYGFLNAGGIHFDLDVGLAVPGGGFTALNYSGGAAQVGGNLGISNSIFVRNNGTSAAVSLTGGRVEHVTCVYLNAEYTTGGYAGRTPNTTFSEMEITCDFDPTNAHLTMVAAVVVAGGDNLSFNHVQFESDLSAASDKVTFPVNAYGNGQGFWGDLVFGDTCEWSGFIRGPAIVAYGAGTANSIRFDGRQPIFSATAGDRQITQRFSKRFEAQELHARGVMTDNLLTQIGAPENEINHCEIGNAFGAAVVPAAPWVLVGAASIGLYGWNGAPHPRQPGPFSRILVLPAGASIYQDIIDLDLSSAGVAHYAINGRAVSFISWQVAIEKLAGNTTAYFSLTNSVTGDLYDDETMQTNGSVQFLRGMTLGRAIEQTTGGSSYPRITIANTGVNPLTIDMSFQCVGSTSNPTFFGTTDPDIIQSDFTVVEQLLISTGVNFPTLLDSYGGFSVANALPLTKGRTYISTDDKKWTYADGDGNYHKVELDPRFGFAAPAYGPVISVDVEQQTVTEIIVTDNVGFTISNPINELYAGQQIIVQIKNLTGGALGIATWSGNYKMGAAWTQPASGKNRSIGFYWDGQFWYETFRSAADVSN